MAEAAIALRAARPDDALCLGVLATQVFLDTYATDGIRPALAREVLTRLSPAAFEALLARPDGACMVAERDGHLLGFAQLGLGRDHELLGTPARAAELERLYVQRPCLGRGLGRALLQAAEEQAAAAGAAQLWLTAWVGNGHARAFYARQGYQELGQTWYEFEGERHENRLFAKRLDDAPLARRLLV
ncbi:MAG TPA: GNAT family N-acetyltransferase [Roseateles sp.]|nr:GNAT family N-acetyltransferase [Roseateles sp.]